MLLMRTNWVSASAIYYGYCNIFPETVEAKTGMDSLLVAVASRTYPKSPWKTWGVPGVPDKFTLDESFFVARRVERLEGYIQILVKRLLKCRELQHAGVACIEEQVKKWNVMLANTMSKFDAIIFAAESIKEFNMDFFRSHPYCKNVIDKPLVELKVLRISGDDNT